MEIVAFAAPVKPVNVSVVAVKASSLESAVVCAAAAAAISGRQSSGREFPKILRTAGEAVDLEFTGFRRAVRVVQTRIHVARCIGVDREPGHGKAAAPRPLTAPDPAGLAR